MVVGGCSLLAVVVDCAIDRFVVFFFGSGMYYFISKYIILL